MAKPILTCSELTAGITAAICKKIAVAGTGPRVILLNYNDVDKIESVRTTDETLSEIVLKGGGKVGYEYASFDNSTIGTFTFIPGTYIGTGTWQHDCNLRIYAKSAAAKKFVNELDHARVIAIVENKEQGRDMDTGEFDGKTKYEAYGWESGLVMTAATGTTEIADGVVYNLTLGNDAISKESTLPPSFWAGTAAATDLAVEALLTPTT
jgi:hypothetical protein